ncbi:MAG: MBL fold metallo-hydrolase [Clostridia bacterium]|nr:MBL fold metallo-hydrolase [Clostridia bacterium]
MKKSKLKKLILLIALAIVVLYDIPKESLDIFNFGDTKVIEDGKLNVCYLDVGQGDCSVIVLPNGKTMMIDGGDINSESTVLDFLIDNGINKIDYLIATHPHSDHIGTLPEIINNFDIGEIYMPRVMHTSTIFESMIDSINTKSLKINTAQYGKRIFNDGNLFAEFIAPVSEKYEELNNYSAVIHLVYDKNSFIFAGDMEKLSEYEVLDKQANINSDVLKVAHHGSSTSSSEEFLKAVSPEYAVISCGADNDYGHPSNKILKRLEKYCNNIYRTDKSGTIVLISDGKSIELK